MLHKYTDFSELATPMIHEFIDRIEVHEADKSTGERTQEIDIYLKYVGKLDVPIARANTGGISRRTVTSQACMESHLQSTQGWKNMLKKKKQL